MSPNNIKLHTCIVRYNFSFIGKVTTDMSIHINNILLSKLSFILDLVKENTFSSK